MRLRHLALIKKLSVHKKTRSFKNCQSAFWNKRKRRISLVINIVGILLFSVSLQPYATVLLLSFLLIKVLPLIKA